MRADEPVRVATETSLPAAETEEFWGIYRDAFAPLRSTAAARQTLHRDEFFEEMDDPRVLKLVARAEDGGAVGLGTLATSLDVVPWISPEYFAARYPEQAAREAIYYVGFMLSHPRRRNRTAFPLMVNAVLELCERDRAALLWDICGYNDENLGLGAGAAAQLRRITGGEADVLDVQTYYGTVFS